MQQDVNNNGIAVLDGSNPQNPFVKALNYEIPKDKIETISGNGNRPLSYVSWSYAWGMFKQLFPDAKYEVVKNPNTGMPYFADPDAGIMVFTKITAAGETHEMWLFVMDATCQAMRLTPYEYDKWNSKAGKWEKKGVKAASVFDINKTIMRCLVKNMAMFGFGLNIYCGDDLPEFDLEGNNSQAKKATAATRKTTKAAPQQQTDRYAGIKAVLASASDMNSLMNLYNQHKTEVDGNPEIKALFTQRKQQIKLLNAA